MSVVVKYGHPTVRHFKIKERLHYLMYFELSLLSPVKLSTVKSSVQ